MIYNIVVGKLGIACECLSKICRSFCLLFFIFVILSSGPRACYAINILLRSKACPRILKLETSIEANLKYWNDVT